VAAVVAIDKMILEVWGLVVNMVTPLYCIFASRVGSRRWMNANTVNKYTDHRTKSVKSLKR
jgi:hypothetical protein